MIKCIFYIRNHKSLCYKVVIIMKSLFNYFEVLVNYRDIRGKNMNELINMLIMTVYGILCSYTDFVNIVYFLKVRKDYFTNL